jgi:hypothetical protein
MSKNIVEVATRLVRERLSEWGDHEVRAVYLDDPATLSVAVGVRCRACGSAVRTSIPLHRIRTDPHDRVVAEELRRVVTAFMQRVPPSCEEARRMAVVRNVMES